MFKTERERCGFTGEYITMILGDTYPVKDTLKSLGARFDKVFKWFFPSDVEVPEDVSEKFETLRIYWNEVGNDDDNLMDYRFIKELLDSKIYKPEPSEYVGSIGERLTLNVICERVFDFDGFYGVSHLHSFKDENGNVLTWSTSSRRLAEGETYCLTGTVKEQKVYRNTKQTVLTRCRVKE